MITRELERSVFYRERIPKLVKQIAVFIFVCFTWIFFRASSLADAFLISGRIFRAAWNDPAVPALMLVLVLVVWLYQFLLESPVREVLKTSVVRVSITVAMVVYLCICSSGAGSFIYFQF